MQQTAAAILGLDQSLSLSAAAAAEWVCLAKDARGKGMPGRGWSVHGLFSRVLAGGALGCVVLFVADALFITPFWQPFFKSAHERWERVFLIAKFGLPAAFILGALAGLAWRWSRPFRLGPIGLVLCCLAVALVSVSLRPVVARVPTTRRSPLYEVVPDLMAAVFGLSALAIAGAAALWHLGRRLRLQSASGKSAAEVPGAAPDSVADRPSD